MNNANFVVIEETSTRLIIADVGPWDKHPTVTNDAENVVQALLPKLRTRRLLYYDSDGELGELLVKDDKFAGFGFVVRQQSPEGDAR